jgi:diguanylate cyclase (GGDEF)-like protein/PAS domain S-box-containing protein
MKKKTGPAKQKKVKKTSRCKQMEEALRKSEERYRIIIEKMEEGYFELDLAGNFTIVNDAECRNMGYTREELIGMNYRQYTDKKNAAKAFEGFNKIYTTGESEKVFDYEIIRKDGSVIYSELSATLIRDAAGKPVGFRGIARHTTERKKYEEELSLLRSAMDISRDMIYLVDRTTMRFLYVNDMACKLTGYTREEYMKIPPQDILHTDRETLEKAYDEVIAASPDGITVEIRTRTKEGTRSIIEAHRTALRIGNRWIIVSTSIDISRRWLAEQSMLLLGRMFAALSASNEAILHATSPEDLYQRVCDAAVEGGKLFTAGVFLFDTETPWVRVAAASGAGMARLQEARISIDESIPEGRGLVGAAYRTGKPCISNDYLNDPASLTWRKIAKEVGAAAVVPLISAGQPIGALAFYAREKRAFDGEVVKLLERMADNVVFGLYNFEHEANRKRAEERIQYFATHDALTDLPNRLMFSQLLNHAIQSAKRRGRQFAVLFMDLDRFKNINDTLGHEAGDRLLQEVALRLKQTLRSADVIARLGGDEFIILVEEVNDTGQVVVVAQKILSTVIKPMLLMGQECRVTASIGISIYPKDDTDEQSLMKNADIAMYFAKEEGKNNFQFYSKDINSQAIERLSIETNLRFALERNELSVYYQAKLDLKTGAITGVEALLRWQSPNLGSVSPVHFIPVAEETGMIVPIGSWVLKTVCVQNVAWQHQGLPPIRVAVNLSLRQLMDDNLLIDIRSALEDSGMDPHLLELEITESMVMHNPARMIVKLSEIKKMGVRLAIDDFGTGYSSLAQIKHFPIDTLKVDRSFVHNIPSDAEDRAITEAIIAMGKTLSLTVVAEGVETQEQMAFLKEHACDEIQGYYFSKPITPEKFADLLRTHVPNA